MSEPEELRNLRWGRYRPLRELGSGGMATVYLAEQTSELGFQRHVAIKRMHPHLAKDLSFLEMFLDEAKVLTSLVHPHIVPLLDVVSKNGELLLVMDFVPGLTMENLGAALREDEERIPPPIAVRIACDFLEGLHAAHIATGSDGAPLHVVHRDVSPHNVLIGGDGRTRIFDFGIAKSDEKKHLTEAGKVRGKALYMAPEQLLGEEVDVRADVYAAGITLWELLVGRPAFRGNSEAAIATNVLRGDLLAPHEVAPEVPRELGECVHKACRPNKAERFESALAFAEALELALPPASHRRVAELVARHADVVRPPSPSLAEGVFATTSDREKTEKPAGKRWLPRFVVGAIGLGGLVFSLVGRDPSPQEEPNEQKPSRATPSAANTSLASSSTPNTLTATEVPEAASTEPALPPRAASTALPSGSPAKEKPRLKPAEPSPSAKPIDDLFGQH